LCMDVALVVYVSILCDDEMQDGFLFQGHVLCKVGIDGGHVQLNGWKGL